MAFKSFVRDTVSPRTDNRTTRPMPRGRITQTAGTFADCIRLKGKYQKWVIVLNLCGADGIRSAQHILFFARKNGVHLQQNGRDCTADSLLAEASRNGYCAVDATGNKLGLLTFCADEQEQPIRFRWYILDVHLPLNVRVPIIAQGTGEEKVKASNRPSKGKGTVGNPFSTVPTVKGNPNGFTHLITGNGVRLEFYASDDLEAETVCRTLEQHKGLTSGSLTVARL
jgi:hypothetical protein